MAGPNITGEAPVDEALAGLPEAGDIIANKYRIEEMIGRGGMGAVYRAQHELLLETVVLKLVLKGLDNDEKARSRFMREARASFQIKSEHVARVLDVDFLDSGKPFMVLEYLQGRDLAQELRRRGAPLEPAQAVEYVLQTLDALAAAHAIGIVHRDLKPANLFLVDTPDGRGKIKVLDFGIAKSTRTSEELTVSRVALGTPQYMSPEQLQDTRTVDARADIWSVGVILFELLTRSHPYPGRDALSVYRTIRAGPAPAVNLLAKDVPAELAAVIARCLRAAPDERFADVGELAQALAPFAVTSSTSSGLVKRIAEVLESSTTESAAVDEDVTAPPTPVVVASGSGSATVMMAPVPVVASVAPPALSAPPPALSAPPPALSAPPPALSAPPPALSAPAAAAPRRVPWALVAVACVGVAGGLAVRTLAARTDLPVAPSASAQTVEVTTAPIVDAAASEPPRVAEPAPSASTTSARIRKPPPPPPTPKPRPSFDPTAARRL